MLGLRAYAEKQAATHLDLARDSARQWIPALAKEGIVPDWATRYKAILTQNLQTSSLTADLDTDMQVDDIDEEQETLDCADDDVDDGGSECSSPDSEGFDIYDLKE
jgi:hypothetical protein